MKRARSYWHGDYVQRGVGKLARPQSAHEFRHHLAGAAVLERRYRRFEVALLREALRADGPELRQAENGPVVLAHVPARRILRQIDPELHAARHDGDFAWRNFELS